jgi:membrane-associated phospholipid phosphatase
MNGSLNALRFTQPRVWVVPALSLLGALALLLTRGNESVFLLLNRLGPATDDVLWASLTILGDTVVALSLGLPLARRRPDLLWAVVPAALLASIWVQAYKPILDVLRPPAVLGSGSIHVIGPAYHYHSFPSGHATTAFAFAGLCVLGFRLGAWSLAPLALAVLVAISRAAVGVHWPLDLLAGACGGWLAAVLGLKLGARLSFGLTPWAQWIIALAFAGCAVALLAGYDTGYPQAIWFQRAIAVLCLGAFALTFVPKRDSHAAPG